MRKLKYFFTNDLGGGGTNVSRVFNYSSLLNKAEHINLLLNYYYLENDFDEKISFNKYELSQIKKFKTINEFLIFFKKEMIDSGSISEFKLDIEDNFRPEIFLDSGSGNILKDLGFSQKIAHFSKNKLKQYIEKEFKEISKNIIDFTNKFKIENLVLIDYAGKNTYKKKEKHNEIYNEVKVEFITDFKKQSSLLIESINHLKKQKNSFNALVPIHGKTIEDYCDYYLKIRELENKENYEFHGFALGGLSTFKKGNDIAKIINFIRSNKDHRIIHVLGSSGLDKLFALIYSGADSFDCHSPWRRASDGQPKFLIPLLNSNLEIIQNEETLAYRPIEDINSNKGCDCDVCANYKANEIFEILNGNNEDNYYAKILLYFHNIYQYEFILKKLNKFEKEDEFRNFVNEIKDLNLKKKIEKDLENLTYYRI